MVLFGLARHCVLAAQLSSIHASLLATYATFSMQASKRSNCSFLRLRTCRLLHKRTVRSLHRIRTEHGHAVFSIQLGVRAASLLHTQVPDRPILIAVLRGLYNWLLDAASTSGYLRTTTIVPRRSCSAPALDGSNHGS